MQNKNSDVRIKKWIARFSGEGQGVTALKSADKARIEIKKAFGWQWADEVATKLVLAEAGTSRIKNPYYINFAREVRGLLNQGYTGGQIAGIVDNVLNKWVGYGLDRDILDRIRSTVFVIGLPTP